MSQRDDDREQSDQLKHGDRRGSGTRLSLVRIARDLIGLSGIDLVTAIRKRARLARVSVPVRRAVTVAVPPERAYVFWRDSQNLPLFMSRLISIEPLDAGRSRWRAEGPAGTLMEWETEILEDRPNESLRWQSLPGSPVGHRAAVYFRPAPGGRGTEVLFQVDYELPAGKLGGWLASVTGHALGVFVQNDLDRFKQIIEAGGVLSSNAGPTRRLRSAGLELARKVLGKGQP